MAAVVIVASGLVLAAGFWWAYFLIPSRTILEQWPDRTFRGVTPTCRSSAPSPRSVQACGWPRRVEEAKMSVFEIALALALPVGAVPADDLRDLERADAAYDLTHVPLFLVTLLPLGRGAPVGCGRPEGPLDLDSGRRTWPLWSPWPLLAALCAVIEVVGSRTRRVRKHHAGRGGQPTTADPNRLTRFSLL